ncbi:MAG: hypothetical protein H0W89_07840 [Candidatus Levybacteria bacterium]|nr:hypothetical protein [Candidatus Levybacteria bacterium]
MKTKLDSIEKSIPEQELQKYNRESGKKTLYLVGILITLVVLLTLSALFLFQLG